jgi:hypothetical protein
MSANEQLLSESAAELRRRIGTKEISPVELLDACIERIERLNPAVNAVTAVCYDRARAEARAAEAAAVRGEALGLLHGLPTGIKDLDETGGLLTTYGSPLYRDFVPERDNAMVARVRAAGAIVVGKTNVPEFGAGANSRNFVWGATGNPFDPGRDGQSFRPDAECGRFFRRFRCRARDGHAPRLHWIRYRRVAAHSRRDLRGRRFSAFAGPRSGGAPLAGMDSDLGRRSDGPHRGRHVPAHGCPGSTG